MTAKKEKIPAPRISDPQKRLLKALAGQYGQRFTSGAFGGAIDRARAESRAYYGADAERLAALKNGAFFDER
jgi:hypothetical protein